MTCLSPEGSQFGAKQHDSEMSELCATERDELLTEKSTLVGIEHLYLALCHEKEKLGEIDYLYPILEDKRSVIIVDCEETLEELSNQLEDKGCRIYAIKNYMDHETRDSIMQESGVVITTDSVSRGFERASFVINYNLPISPMKYLHRIGRSGKFVSKLVVISFATVKDLPILLDIQRSYKVSLDSRGPFDCLLRMAGFSQGGSQFGAKHDSKTSELSAAEMDKLFRVHERVENTFSKMNLKGGVLRGLLEYGYEVPSQIQQRGILPLCEDAHVFVQAKSEPRRTSTFCTAILQKLDCSLAKIQALVLVAPLRGEDISIPMEELGKFLHVKVQCGAVREGAHVVVSTLREASLALQKKSLGLDEVKIVVLDDADELVKIYSTKYFKDANDQHFKIILESLPAKFQVCVFSETISQEVVELGHKFMRGSPAIKPYIVAVKKDEISSLEGIDHFYVYYEEKETVSGLLELVEALYKTKQCVIFVDCHSKVKRLADKLQDQTKLKVTAMGRDMTQREIDSMMEELKAGGVVVITVDTLARGQNFQASCVINFDMPENYRQRFGPFARKEAITAINFVNEKNMRCLLELERVYDIQFGQLALASSMYGPSLAKKPKLLGDGSSVQGSALTLV